MANSEAKSMADAAALAWQSGARYFTPVINFPALKLGFSGPIDDWPPVLEAIESAGWTLHTWAMCPDGNGRPQAMPLFTR